MSLMKQGPAGSGGCRYRVSCVYRQYGRVTWGIGHDIAWSSHFPSIGFLFVHVTSLVVGRLGVVLSMRRKADTTHSGRRGGGCLVSQCERCTSYLFGDAVRLALQAVSS